MRLVPRELLGKIVVRRGRNGMTGRIVETEAYLGRGDAAAHAAAGLTPRNRVLFGEPGHAYVYFIYGNHYCLNVSCMLPGEAGCVLIRALEPVVWKKTGPLPRTSGPGRLCKALGITRARDNGKDLTSRRSDLAIYDDGSHPGRIAVTCRIGIGKSVEMQLRYVIAGNQYVSR